MPTIVGILTFISRINFSLSLAEHKNIFMTLEPGLGEDIKMIVSFAVSLQKPAEVQCKYKNKRLQKKLATVLPNKCPYSDELLAGFAG